MGGSAQPDVSPCTLSRENHYDGDIFSGKNLTDNVALLFTDRPFVLGPNLDKICLPSSAIYPRFDPDECYATGWGKDAFGDEGKFQARRKTIGDKCILNFAHTIPM